MKNILIAIALLLSTSLTAQISFNTGSVSLDTDLNTINVNAKANLGAFNTNLSIKYNISEQKIESLQASAKLQPAEMFLSLELASISNRSVDDVVAVYKKNRTSGWGVVAKEIGIKPGSPEFHALKAATSSKKEKGNSAGKGNGNSKKGNPGKGKGKK